jgi:hypothetical protein
VTRITTTRLIAEQFPKKNSRKTTRLALKPNLDPERSLSPSFSKKLMHLKGNRSLKRMQALRRGRLNPSSILKLTINLTTSSDEGKKLGVLVYFF